MQVAFDRRALERFAPKPGFLGGLEDGAALETLHHLEEREAHRFGSGYDRLPRGLLDHALDARVEVPGLALQMRFQELRRELDGDEAVLVLRARAGREGRRALEVEDAGAGTKLDRLAGVGQGRLAVEVEAQLQAARMKTARPIQLRLRFEIVPLKAEAEGAKTAK